MIKAPSLTLFNILGEYLRRASSPKETLIKSSLSTVRTDKVMPA